MLDDVGFGALGCCGGIVDTPNIDRIAAAGLRQPLAHHGVVLPDRSCLRPCQLRTGRIAAGGAVPPMTSGTKGPPIDLGIGPVDVLVVGVPGNQLHGQILAPRPRPGRALTPARRPDPYHEPGHRRICASLSAVRAVVIGWSRIASAGFSPSASARVIRARGNCLGNGLLSAGWSSKHGCVPPAHGIDGPKRYGVHPGRQVAPMAGFYPAGSSDTSEHEPLPGPRSHPVSDCSSIGKQSCPEPPRLGP